MLMFEDKFSLINMLKRDSDLTVKCINYLFAPEDKRTHQFSIKECA